MDACRLGVARLEGPPRNNFEPHFASVTAGLVNSPDTSRDVALAASGLFHVFLRRRFETGLALLNRCRAHCAVTPDFSIAAASSPRRARMGISTSPV
jgi:hypothetical protein